MPNRMRKSTSEGRFPLEDLVDLGEPINKLECTQNLRSMFHRVPSLGHLGRLELNKLTKSKTRYFAYLFIVILFVVIGSLMARVAYKRARESRHINLAEQLAIMEDPIINPPGAGKISIVETLQAKDLQAFDIQLMSLKKNFKLEDLSVFLIVASPEDFTTVDAHVRKCNEKYEGTFPFRVVSASAIVPEQEYMTKHSETEVAPYYKEHHFGYITRMIAKLSAFEWIPGEFYLALDADVMCVKPTSYATLIPHGKAITNFGKGKYDTAYQWKGAKHVLDAPKSMHADQTVYGGVPSIYHRMAVNKLKTYLEIIYQQPWRYSLLRYLYGWSDYSLYFSFLKIAGIFDKHHSAVRDGLFRSQDGRIGSDELQKWGESNLTPSQDPGYFVHLNGMIELPVSEVNSKIRPYFELGDKTSI
ncbi:hypothetical protein AAMO2058_000608500 [Amorphochlora amoebiformis]